MAFRPERAREVLPQVDPARLRWGWPVGLRDGALLALIAAGITAEELAELKASAITMERGRLRVGLRRYGVAWYVVLSADLGSRVLAWLNERRLWAAPEPVFTGIQGQEIQEPLSAISIYQILHRYRQETRPTSKGRQTMKP